MAMLTKVRVPAPRPLAPGQPGYDAAARKELDRRTARIAQLKIRGDVDRWHEGAEFLAVRDLKLYRQDGYLTFGEWLVFHSRRSPATVYRRIDLAETFSLAQLRKHGKERLDLVLKYVGLTVAKDEAWRLDSLLFKVPGPNGLEELPLRRLETWQLLLAVSHQHKLAQRRLEEDLSDPEQEFIDELARAMMEKERPLAGVTARRSDSGHPDDTELTIKVRVGDLASVVPRLQKVVEERARGPKSRRRDH